MRFVSSFDLFYSVFVQKHVINDVISSSNLKPSYFKYISMKRFL